MKGGRASGPRKRKARAPESSAATTEVEFVTPSATEEDNQGRRADSGAPGRLTVNPLWPGCEGREVKGNAGAVRSLMGRIQQHFPTFQPGRKQTKQEKVFVCTAAGCTASVVFRAAEQGAVDPQRWLVSHTVHNHPPCVPLPGSEVRGGVTRRSEDMHRFHIVNGWLESEDTAVGGAVDGTSGRPQALKVKVKAPVLQGVATADGPGRTGVLPVHLPAVGMETDRNGVMTRLVYAGGPDPKPPSPHLVELVNPGAIKKILDKFGFGELPRQPIRVFDIDMSSAKAIALEALQVWAGISGVSLCGVGQKVVRGRPGRNVAENIGTWYEEWQERCPFGLLDVTGQNVLVCGVEALADGGKKRAPLVAVGQVGGAEGKRLRDLVSRKCQLVDDAGAWAHIEGHYDGAFWMAGLASPPRVGHIMCRYVNQTVFMCEAEHDPHHVEDALQEMCEEVWLAAVRIMPTLEKYRSEFLSAWGQAAMYGNTGTNLISRTKNCAVSLHFDTTDGPYSIMLWTHNGQGKIHGGHFLMPGVSLKVLPTDMTLVVLAAGMVTHGTAPARTEGEARRYGFSHFLRVPAMERVARLIKEAGSKDKLEEVQVEGMKAVLRAPSTKEREEARGRIKELRDEMLESITSELELQGANHVAFGNAELVWYRDLEKCLTWEAFTKQASNG